jgi:tRNA pseudouridine55 synthase
MRNGILLLDKPVGPSSHTVLGVVKRWAGTRKVGHLGTLDPMASGLLPAIVGRATLLARFLEIEPKRYTATILFGVDTTTADAEGTVIQSTDPGSTPPADWNEIVLKHTGLLQLEVPLFAAVKVKGRPLYEYGRSGEDVELPVKSMQVDILKSDVSQWPRVELDITCGTGTYIRALASSMGSNAGVGAHVVRLRRHTVGRWNVAQAVTPDSLDDEQRRAEAFIEIDQALHCTSLPLEHDEVERVMAGRAPGRIRVAKDLKLGAGERFAFTDEDGRLLAVARSSHDWTASQTPPAFEFERVVARPS